MTEVPLSGGRVTPGVVRVADTVRRPPAPNAAFVHALLEQLDAAGFDGVPRYLGRDELGREIFTFLEGDVPLDLDPALDDTTLAAAARLIRRFHDAAEDVCHNDLSPCNVVFREGNPVGIIDFDAAAPGDRLHDLGYALFTWLNLGTDGPPPHEQSRRIDVFCRAYGIAAGGDVIDAIVDAVAANVERLRAHGRVAELEWWEAQLNWLRGHAPELLYAA